MRLLQLRDGELSLTHPFLRDVPRYAILSHTWGHDGEEVTFQDVVEKRGRDKTGYQKIMFCGEQAKRDGLEYFWVDTCCIDKRSSAELTEAINSMFRWYHNAVHCYVYMSDVLSRSDQTLNSWKTQFRRSRWHTRGWTLQELLAPISVRFFSAEGVFLGDRTSLENEIFSITKIEMPALRGSPLDQFPELDRMNWASNRQTTKEEDAAYCLLGIFDVNIPLIYGEGKTKAMNRLRRAVAEQKGMPYIPPQNRQLDLTLNILPTTSEASQGGHLMIPFGQNEDFVGREIVLTELVSKILPKAKRNDCQRTVVEGLGGVGKTQIALEAAYRVNDQDSDCSIFWVPAVDAVFFENAYKEIGKALGIPGINDEKADVKALVKTALEKSTRNWLLIIDNVDDIGLLTGGGLQDYLPFSRKGSILFTTRSHEVSVRLDVSKGNIFTVAEMSEDEASEMLQNGLRERQYRDIQATKNLVRHLVYLPLAIKQASAYMARTHITIARYLQLCYISDETQLKLLNTNFEERRRYSNETNPITVTWLISFQHLAESCPLAVEYLKLICFLSEKDIPMSLLPLGEDEEGPEKDEAVGILEGYAFISVREQGDSFDIHRLVRLATRNWIKDEWEACCTKVIQHLTKVYPIPEHDNRQVWIRYMPHAEIALQVHEQCIDKEAKAYFLFVMADSYDVLGKYKESEELYREAIELNKSIRPPTHPWALESLNNLAGVLDNLGKYNEAEQIYRDTLELKKMVLGLDDPSTLNSMNNLATTLDNMGKYEEAERMYRETLELKSLVLTPNDPSMLATINNLANTLGNLGKYEEAEQMYRETLELRMSALNPNHPWILDSMNNLAGALDMLGKYKEAEQIHRETLELRRSTLGPSHPSIFFVMHNLAITLDNMGKYEEAERMYRETLELKKSVLGPDHPSTIRSRNNLRDLLEGL